MMRDVPPVRDAIGYPRSSISRVHRSPAIARFFVNGRELRGKHVGPCRRSIGRGDRWRTVRGRHALPRWRSARVMRAVGATLVLWRLLANFDVLLADQLAPLVNVPLE